MKANKILVPVDFSESSDAALDWATVLARDTGATLLIIHVETVPLTTGGGEYIYAIPEPATQELLERLHKVVPRDSSIPIVHRLLAGDPAEAILRAAQSEGVDMIVMGTHGRRGITRLLMGSVAEAIVRRAECPVLILKHTSKVPAEAGA
ncbi:MAG TPA: universal stress protein [Pirellulaceae bacterium]|nr:universal stress protein [Pirellulaceae bacterium]